MTPLWFLSPSYPERLFVTDLPSLEIKRLRYDCVLLYNILHGNLYIINNFFLYRFVAISSIINTRGHDFRLVITLVDCNVKMYFFFIRTALMRISLPSDVFSARYTKLFNEHLLGTYLY